MKPNLGSLDLKTIATEMTLQSCTSLCRIYTSHMPLHLDVEDSKYDTVTTQPLRHMIGPSRHFPRWAPVSRPWALSLRTCNGLGPVADQNEVHPGNCQGYTKVQIHGKSPPPCGPSLKKFWAPDAYSVPVALNWGDSAPKQDPWQCLETFWIAITGRENMLLAHTG